MVIKSTLIIEINKEQRQLSEKDILLSINALLRQMSHALSAGGRIEIRGYGSFSLHYRQPRRAHNPKTGEKLMTSSKYAVHFKPGKELRERINKTRHLPIQHAENDAEDDDS